MPPKLRKLSGKQLAFCEAYLANGGNAYRAAEKAGYKGNPVTLRNVGSENLTKDYIAKYISERIIKKMGADEVIERLTNQARVDISWFVEIEGQKGIINSNAIKEYGYLIKELRPTKAGLVIKLHDSQNALKLLAQHHALLTDKQHNYNINVSELSNDQLQRIAKGEDPLVVISDPGEG